MGPEHFQNGDGTETKSDTDWRPIRQGWWNRVKGVLIKTHGKSPLEASNLIAELEENYRESGLGDIYLHDNPEDTAEDLSKWHT